MQLLAKFHADAQRLPGHHLHWYPGAEINVKLSDEEAIVTGKIPADLEGGVRSQYGRQVLGLEEALVRDGQLVQIVLTKRHLHKQYYKRSPLHAESTTTAGIPIIILTSWSRNLSHRPQDIHIARMYFKSKFERRSQW